MTASHDEELDIENSLGGADLTLRKSSLSWIKLETGPNQRSGRFGNDLNRRRLQLRYPRCFWRRTMQSPQAYRVDTSLGFKDIFTNGRGQVTFYLQDLEAGYSAPGLIATGRERTQYGGTADLPFTDRLSARRED